MSPEERALVEEFIRTRGITKLPPGRALGATGYYHSWGGEGNSSDSEDDKPKKPAKRGRTSRFEKHKDSILQRVEEGESIAAIARSFKEGSGSLNNLIKRWQKSDD
jgi:hypothetical protein